MQNSGLAKPYISPKQIYFRGFFCFLLFATGLLPNETMRPLQLLGWIFWIDLVERLSVRRGLAISLMVNLGLSLAGTYWIEYFGAGFTLKAVALSFWVLPAVLAVKTAVQRLPGLIKTYQMAWILAWLIAGFWPSGTPLLQGFFNFPLILEQILHYFPARQGLLILSSAWIGLAAGLAPNKSSLRLITGFCAAILIAASLLGLWRFTSVSQSSSGPRTALVQHNMPFFPKSEDLKRLLEKSAAEAALQNPELIVFPLFDLPESLQRDLIDPTDGGFFSDLAQRSGAAILTASKISHAVSHGQFSNQFSITAVLRLQSGTLAGIHQSAGRSFFHDKNQILAAKYQIIEAGKFGKIGVLISYELEKPKNAQSAKELGADYLIGLSNPGDSPSSPLPSYQLREIRRRAIETGLPIFTVTPNGYTAWIDGCGRVLSKSRKNNSEIIYANLPQV